MLVNSRRLFGTNGIRGIVNKDLTPQVALQTGMAVGTFFARGSLVVGHDARMSSPSLTNAVIAGLNSTGCNVFVAGLMPTPALQFWIRHHEVDGGVIITASHNPAEYNGIKVIWKDGIELSREQEIEVERTYFGNQAVLAQWNRLGETRELKGMDDEYVAAIKKHVNLQAIRRKRYRVIVDAANSVGGLTGPRLLRELGCRVTEINSKMDGSFPGRLPEPRPENLGGLSSTVKSVGADLGVAFDSDADRVIFVDENGRIASGDEGFGLIEKHFLMENQGEKIVTSISSSTMIEDIAEEYGGEVVWTKIGSITVSKTMKKLNAKLGGEEYGGIFYGPHQPVRDGAMATALVLGIMARTGQSSSKLLGELPQYFTAKARIACSEQLKNKVLEKLVEQVKGWKVSTLDGIKIWFDDKSAILVRPSGTEPVYRLYSEAKTAGRAKQLIREYGSSVRKTVEILSARAVA
jgi:phosphomannomutase/phosphoglucomutase